MDDWEKTHTNATLLKPAKYCYSALELYRAMKRQSGKVDLAIYCYFIVLSG